MHHGSALFACLADGIPGADSAVVAVLASTACAMIVVLVGIFTREAMSWGQWLGVATTLAGIAISKL